MAEPCARLSIYCPSSSTGSGAESVALPSLPAAAAAAAVAARVERKQRHDASVAVASAPTTAHDETDRHRQGQRREGRGGGLRVGRCCER